MESNSTALQGGPGVVGMSGVGLVQQVRATNEQNCNVCACGRGPIECSYPGTCTANLPEFRKSGIWPTPSWLLRSRLWPAAWSILSRLRRRLQRGLSSGPISYLEWMPAWVYGAGWSLQAVSRILGLASTRAGAARSSSIGNPTLTRWRRRHIPSDIPCVRSLGHPDQWPGSSFSGLGRHQ